MLGFQDEKEMMRPCPDPDTVAGEPIGAQATGSRSSKARAVFRDGKSVSKAGGSIEMALYNERIFGEMGGRHRPAAGGPRTLTTRGDRLVRGRIGSASPVPTFASCRDRSRAVDLIDRSFPMHAVVVIMHVTC